MACCNRVQRTAAQRLQWGHGREAMDGPQRVRGDRRHDQLQWGHGREAMDGCKGVQKKGCGAWLQWGHGREAMDGSLQRRQRLALHRFNGAMAVRPWMVAWPPPPPNRGHCFNGAMAVRPH